MTWVRRLPLCLSVVIGFWVGGPLPSTEALAATVSLDRGVLSYRATPGERNEPYVTVLRSSAERAIQVRDAPPVHLAAGTGCTATVDTNGYAVVRCSLAAGAPLPRVRMALGDAADRGTVEGLLARIIGGPGDDGLSGTGPLEGGPGRDGLLVTRGLVPRGPVREARGGSGRDYLEVAGGVAVGAVLDGGRGDDELNGGSGRDVLRGGPGDDDFYDPGEGGPGDVYRLGPGRDDALLNDGADTVFARDGQHDEIDCGFARETVILDGLDFYGQEVEPCQRVRRSGLARILPDIGVAYLEYDFGQDEGPNELEVLTLCPHDLGTCRGTLTVYDSRGLVAKRRFRFVGGGQVSDGFRLPKRTLRRLARWARITVVSYDRAGGLHRHTIAGPSAVVINEPEPS